MDQYDFEGALEVIKKHVATCGDCQDFASNFLRKNPKDNSISIRHHAVRRWTLNGPTTSLEQHPFQELLMQCFRTAILSATDAEHQLAIIFHFEYSVLWRNRLKAFKKDRKGSRTLARRAGSAERPWLA